MNPSAIAETLQEAADSLLDLVPAPDTLRVLQRAEEAIGAAKAALVVELVETRAHEAEGSSSVTAWLRAQLRLDTREANALISAGPTLTTLPLVGAAMAEGRIRAEHVRLFAYGLKHIGAEVMTESQDWLVEVAATSEPVQLKQVVKALREAVYPDELDQAWIDGMARRDITVSAVPDGFHVHGFLDTATGAKLQAVLNSLSAPRDAHDQRTGSERRVEGLDALLTGVLEHGLPQDRGTRPHLSVIVDADQLADAVDVHGEDQQADALSDLGGSVSFLPGARADAFAKPSQPAHLVGFGAIGRRFLSELMCGADLTPILTGGGKHAVLDLGPTVRYANRAQRRAVNASQGGICGTPGCTNPVVHIHHIIWHSRGGPTDLANLMGFCPKCHTLIHQGKIIVDPDTHDIRRRSGPVLHTNPSNHYHQRRAAYARIRASHRTTAPPGITADAG